MNLKIQILAGNTLMSIFHVGFEIELPLDEKVLQFDIPDGISTIIFIAIAMRATPSIYASQIRFSCRNQYTIRRFISWISRLSLVGRAIYNQFKCMDLIISSL